MGRTQWRKLTSFTHRLRRRLTASNSAEGPLSLSNVTGVYLPSLILIFGVAIVKQEWVPYAAAAAAIAGGLKIYLFSCMGFLPHHTSTALTIASPCS